MTALHHAALKGHCAVVEQLITSGAKVDAVDSFGRGPEGFSGRFGSGSDEMTEGVRTWIGDLRGGPKRGPTRLIRAGILCRKFVFLFPASLCGVRVFGCALPPASSSSCRLPPPHNFHTQLVHTQLPHTQLVHTQLAHTQLVHTQSAHAQLVHNNLLAHNLITHNFLTHNLPTHTTSSHTTCPHTTYSHTTCSHTAYSHTTYSHTTSV